MVIHLYTDGEASTNDRKIGHAFSIICISDTWLNKGPWLIHGLAIDPGRSSHKYCHIECWIQYPLYPRVN